MVDAAASDIVDKHEWLRLLAQCHQEQIVTTRQTLCATPCLYFGTRRCTYSDVVSVVTTVHPLSRTTAVPSVVSPGKQQLHKPTEAWQSLTSNQKEHGILPSFATVSASNIYSDSPLANGHESIKKQQQRSALAYEKHVFMTKLTEKRQQRFTLEQNAALAIQRVHRGYVLRKRFREIRQKLQVRKRIRVNLVKVTKGTAIITGEKERKEKILQEKNDAARKLQFLYQRWSARKIVTKERSMRLEERLNRSAKLIQTTWRLSIARMIARKLQQRQKEEQQRKLAATLHRLFLGFEARQRVRRRRLRRQVVAAQRIQWISQRLLARKALCLEKQRHIQQQQHTAAIQIQKYLRRYLQQRYVITLRVEEDVAIRVACVVTIQRVIRGFIGRQRMRFHRVFLVNHCAYVAAIHIARIVRGFLARRRVMIEKIYQETDLLVQTRKGDLNTVTDLLDGAGIVDEPVDITTALSAINRNNALHVTCKHGHDNLLTLLTQRMLTTAPDMVYALNHSGESPLELAIVNGYEELAVNLLTMTSSLFVKTQIHRKIVSRAGRERTLLHLAARQALALVIAKIALLAPQLLTGKELDSWTKRTLLHESLVYEFVEEGMGRSSSINSQRKNKKMLATMRTILTKVPQVKVDQQDFVGFTALHLAAAQGNLAAVRLLLEYGADVALLDAQGRTAWRIALLQGHEACFLEIRRKWLDEVNGSLAASSQVRNDSEDMEKGNGASKALTDAAMKTKANLQLHPQLEQEIITIVRQHEEPDLEILRFYIEECHVSVNATAVGEDGGESLLMAACKIQHLRVIKYLLSVEEIDVNYSSQAEQTALEIVVTSNLAKSKVIADLLLRAGADPCRPFGPKQRTALHEAARRGYCIQNWFNTSFLNRFSRETLARLVDSDGRTLLHDASTSENAATAKFLINFGLSIDRQESATSQTPLHDACRAGHVSLVSKMLRKCPQAVYIVDNRGRSPLFGAVEAKSVECLALLLRNVGQQFGEVSGSSIKMRQKLMVDFEGCHILDYAANCAGGDNSSAVVQCLREHMAESHYS